MSYVALREGKLTKAHQIFSDIAGNFQENNYSIGVVFALEGMAGIYAATGKPEYAAQLIGWSDRTRKAIGDPRPRIDKDDLDRDIAAIMAKIGSSAFEIAYDSGRKMTLDEAVAFVLDKKN